MILPLLLLAAAPDDAYRSLLLSRGPLPQDAKPQVREVKQPYFKRLEFFRGSGWSAGGHRELEAATLVAEGAGISVVIAEAENLDEDGYHQCLKGLWLCPIEHERLIRSTLDLAKLSSLVAARATKCTSLIPLVEERFTKALAEKQPVAWLDGYAGFVAALFTGHATLTPLRKPDAQKNRFALDGGAPPAFAPWVTLTEGARFAGMGMAAGTAPETLELLEVRFEPRYTRERALDGGTEPPSAQNRLSVTRKTVAFTRRYIE